MPEHFSGSPLPVRCSLRCFMATPLLRKQQIFANAIQIGQAEQRVHLRQILLQASITHFGVPPQALDHQIGVFADRAPLRVAAVARTLALAQRLTARATLTHQEAQSDGHRQRLRSLGVVSRVAIKRLFLTMQQLRHHVRIMHIGGGRFDRVHQSRFRIGTGVHLHPEMVSRPRELPPQPLAEPYVSVSAHTAPLIQRLA